MNSKKQKRLGRGIGSGRGKTSGRGTKGQKARGKIPPSFIGGTLPLYKRLPFKRGKGNMKTLSHAVPVALIKLAGLPVKSIVNLDFLIKEKIISRKDTLRGVKILGKGPVEKALTVNLPVSKTAREAIEKAGGKIKDV